MPIKLPDGWLDTGITATETLECDLELRAQVGLGGYQTYSAQIDNVGLYFYTRAASGATSLGCTGLWTSFTGGITSFQSYSTVEAVLYDEDTATTTVVASGAGNCTPGWLPAVRIQKVFGPLRLGVTIQDGRLRYGWFTDASSVETYSVAGVEKRRTTFADPPALTNWQYTTAVGGATSTVNGMGTQLQFERYRWSNLGSGEEGETTYTHVRYSNFTFNAVAMDPNTAKEYKQVLGGTGGGFNIGERFGWAWRYTMDLAATDADGTSEAANATYGGTRTCPVSFAYRQDWWNDGAYSPTYGGNRLTAPVLADPWLSAQSVTPYSADQTFDWAGNAPKDPTQLAPTTWNTGSITVAASRSVLLSSNAWTPSSGSLTVGGTPTAPTFTAAAAGTSATKTLLSYWRNWNTSSDPKYHADDGYRTTKADYYGDAGQDIWGWSLYAYLDVAMNCPAETALTFEVSYAVVNHAGTIDTIARTYTKTFPAGASTQRLDLLFPTESGRPFYGERAESVKISGFTSGAGTYTLSSMTLVADQQPYLKLGGKKQTLKDGSVIYGGAVLAVDGSGLALHWGKENLLSPSGDADGDGFTDYRGDHQNGVFLKNGTALDRYGRAPAMTEDSLQPAIEELHRIEGVTATYSAAAIDAAFTDGYGNSIGIDGTGNPLAPTRWSYWLALTMPHVRLTAGSAYTVLAQLVADGVVLAAGTTAGQAVIFARNTLGAVIECLCTDASGNRAAAGSAIKARLYTGGGAGPSDPLLASASCDAAGYATLPIRTGQYGGLEFNVYLTDV